MITVKSKYTGDLSTEAIHVKSNNHIVTDAPTDNNGKGQAFSPTDLVAAALGSCMMTVMAIAGEKKGLDMSGMNLEATKIMTANPRRISEIKVDFFWESCSLSTEDREWIKHIGLTCPVALSLGENLKQDINFHF
ncbi:MAG: osmotically inducible protein OsmC [Cytophagales bacterium CG12_big_fil_rev_8_21_14_0_65_40_12]|nr:MAG: osmotically inducible protein OsmC [Cytophagales bacterium CG12_big_fil_rev_8_21_14_0_65_40_12]PIW03396.1 MAG: osmotically inducible protein OsmC [Cytophagales bacterium CG17_big_fil_post_rev_8_21_14_2_50_40_13]